MLAGGFPAAGPAGNRAHNTNQAVAKSCDFFMVDVVFKTTAGRRA